MDLTRQLKGIKYRLENLIEDFEVAIQQSQKEQVDVRLTPRQANDVMGYSDDYIYKLDVLGEFEDGLIGYHDLYEWAKEHKPSRLKRMRKNIKEFN